MELKKTPVNEPGTPPPHQPGPPNQPEQPTDAGQHLNRIITAKNKEAVFKWTRYQTEPVSPEDFEAMRRHPAAYGEAVICGPISGGLEVIDIDTKNDPDRTLHHRYFALIGAANPDLFSRLHIVLTAGGGAHIYYRCANPEKNKALARRNPTADESRKAPRQRIVLIETRGTGGYAITYPTPGYTIFQGTPETIPFITDAERAELFGLARSFAELIPEPDPVLPRSPQAGSLDTVSPWQDFNDRATASDIDEILKAAGWQYVYTKGPKNFYKRPGETTAAHSGDWNEDLRLFGVFSTSTVFIPERGYKPAAVMAELQFNGDWKATAAHLRALGYGKTIDGHELQAANRARDLMRAGKPEPVIIDKLIEEKLADDEADARLVIEQAEQLTETGKNDFWSFEKGGRVSINLTRFIFTLEQWGYARLEDGSNGAGGKPTYIHTQGRIVRTVSPEEMAHAAYDYLRKESAPAEVEEQVRRQASQTFTDSYLKPNLKARRIQTLRDTPETKYLPFLNGVAAMDKAGNVTLIDYTQAPAYVWQDHIIQREFVPDPNFVLSLHDCEFYQFLKCIAGEHEAPAHAPAEDIPRTNYALRVFGYLCDTVKDPTRPWCIVLSEETADDNKGGGTGKGVFMRGVSHAAPVCFIDGKGMKPEDPELFSRVEPFITRVAFIDDAQKKFSIEVLNNAISDTFVMRRLYKGQTAIPYSDSPKVAVSTNYAVDTEANHAARRVRQFEFSPTFGPRFTPSDYFGHLLFSDWDNDEWNRFFNLVFYAVGAYRRHPQGLEDRPPSPNAAIKQALIRYGRDFVEWIHAVRPEYAGKEIARQKAYEDFQAYTGATEKDFGARKFYEAMRTTAAKLGLAFSEVRTNSVRTYKFYEVE